MEKNDRRYMLAAIQEAGKSHSEDERVHPKVGVVVVKSGRILAKAFRGEIDAGGHAEFTALEKKLGTDSIAGATVYTTLEPCVSRNHPKVPCAYRLIERRVARVVVGMLDPNQAICGRGIRALRDASIATDLFPDELMSVVEEQNRDFIRDQVRISAAQAEIREMATTAGLSAIFPSRDHYRKYRVHASSIDKYIETAKHTLVLVSVNLMTGVAFDGLCHMLKRKLEKRSPRFSALISLLNPKRRELMSAMASVLDMDVRGLTGSIEDTVTRLKRFRRSLSQDAQQRFTLHAHNAVPFGSAILLDHDTADGRIQIETKPYKAPIRDSFAIEVVPCKDSGLYQPLVEGYLRLVKEADSL